MTTPPTLMRGISISTDNTILPHLFVITPEMALSYKPRIGREEKRPTTKLLGHLEEFELACTLLYDRLVQEHAMMHFAGNCPPNLSVDHAVIHADMGVLLQLRWASIFRRLPEVANADFSIYGKEIYEIPKKRKWFRLW